MPGFSDYLEDKLLDWAAKRTAFPTTPNTLHVSLHFADPEGDGNSELNTTADADGESPGYARVAYNTDTNNATNTQFTAKTVDGTGKKVTNQIAVAFAAATGAWNQATGSNLSRAIKWFGIWDAGTGGNFLFGGEILPSGTGVTVENGQQLSFDPAKLTVKVD
jgi:hypothetical protein